MGNEPKILSTAIALPEFSRTTSDILPYVDAWLADQPERFRKKVNRIFKYAKVDRRYSVMDIDQVFQQTSFAEKNNFFLEKSIDLAEEALVKALDKANLKASDLDFIITVCCTTFMIPSVDAYLINRLRMKQDIVRLPVTEMGCAAGISGLIYAHNLLKANPGKRAAVIAVESPTSNFQLEDYTMTNMVCAAIFGDGAAAAILGFDDKPGPTIQASEMYHFYDEIGMMGYDVKNTGFHMVLDPSVPAKIEQHFHSILYSFLEKNQLSIDDIQHFIFHPGGKRIVEIVDKMLAALGKNIEETKAVLAEYGNMSSATVLYVLDRYLEKEIPLDDLGIMLSFGPGFSAQRVLLRWEA